MCQPTLRLLNRLDKSQRPLFELVEDYHYRLGPGCVVTVPSGYITNFGTIPRWLWWWMSPTDLREAAIVHDFMCNEYFNDDDKPGYAGYSRWLADSVLYEAMARLGFGWLNRAAVFAAVRIHAMVLSDTKWPRGPEALMFDAKD